MNLNNLKNPKLYFEQLLNRKPKKWLSLPYNVYERDLNMLLDTVKSSKETHEKDQESIRELLVQLSEKDKEIKQLNRDLNSCKLQTKILLDNLS